MVRISLLLLVAALANTASAVEAPERFPDFNWETVTSRLVIATLAPGKSYPDEPGCDGEVTSTTEPVTAASQLDSICIDMDPPPFWLVATVRKTLLGEVPPDKLTVSTNSHYGMPSRDELAGVQWLLPLLTDGEHFMMPRYARAALVESRWGELYLPLYDEHPPPWLPCGVEALREEIAATDFATDLAFPRDQFPEVEDEAEAPHLRFTKAGVLPRYGISMTRLQMHMDSLFVPPGRYSLGCVP